MAVIKLDTRGLKCPQPILKIAAKVPSMTVGDVLEVFADCSTFEKDVKMWCERSRKTLLFCMDVGGGEFKAHIQI